MLTIILITLALIGFNILPPEVITIPLGFLFSLAVIIVTVPFILFMHFWWIIIPAMILL